MDYTKPNSGLYNIPFHMESYNGMPYRALGKSGLCVPAMGLGTWKFGLPETGDGARTGERQAFEIFERAVELGVCFWDTANRYNNASGNSERVIGRWLKNNPEQRRNLVIATKIAGGMDGLTPNHCGLSRGNIMEAVYACLQRLQTDHIDLLYFHVFDPYTPIEESLSAIEDLVKQDLVRYFAVSNFTMANLNAYQAVEAGLSVRSRIVAVQNQFDILQGEAASHAGVLDQAADAGISFIAWSPLAKGLLTEKYFDLTSVGKGDRLFDEGSVGNIDPIHFKKIKKLAALAGQWDLKLNQLTLAYMLSLRGMGPVIPSSATVSQLESNATGSKIVLNEEQQQQVKNALQ